MKRKPSKIWETCLRIPQEHTADVAPVVDETWLAARGVYSSSPTVIRMLQEQVLPLVRKLQEKHGLDYFYFLVHDRNSGVPTTKNDTGAYIHLELAFRSGKRSLALPRNWVLTRPKVWGDEIGGINKQLLNSDDIGRARHLIAAQSRWVLDFLECHKFGNDPLAMVQQTRQFLHYFANMLQMKAVG